MVDRLAERRATWTKRISGRDPCASGDRRRRARSPTAPIERRPAASLKDFGNVTLTTEAARRSGLRAGWRPLRDLLRDVRYAIRVLAKNPGVLADRLRRAHARHRPQRHGVHAVQESRAQPAGRHRGSAQPRRGPERDESRPAASLSYPDYQYVRDHDRAFVGLVGSRNSTSTWARAAAPSRHGRIGDRQLLSGCSACAHSSAGRAAIRRSRARAAPGRRPERHALAARSSAADPTSSARPRVNTYPLTVVGVAARRFTARSSASTSRRSSRS